MEIALFGPTHRYIGLLIVFSLRLEVIKFLALYR